MRILVTGSSGHLGEALVRVLRGGGEHEPIGVDIKPSPFTTAVGSIADPAFVARAMEGVDAVLHTATLHKPHIGSHTRRDFVEVNVAGTLVLLEAAVAAGVGAFVFTSSTSAFGRALTPPPGAPAAWITEDVVALPRNIYGATKVAAEDLCELIHRDHALPCLVLRTSRFFPEDDDRAETRSAYSSENAKLNELLYRRADLGDVVDAHLRAIERAPALGFARLIVSATTPFTRDDVAELARDAPAALGRLVPEYAELYAARGWRMFDRLDRVYANDRARAALGWDPVWSFAYALERIAAGEPTQSELAQAVGAKGYHETPVGVYTVR